MPKMKFPQKSSRSYIKAVKLGVLGVFLFGFFAFHLAFIASDTRQSRRARSSLDSLSSSSLSLSLPFLSNAIVGSDSQEKCEFDIASGGNVECEGTDLADESLCQQNADGCIAQDGILNYVGFFCVFPGKYGSLVILIPWLLCLFYLLGMTAEDFFCPILTIVSETLQLSPEVAGITILALGNGSPDVFSTFVAIQHPQSAGFDVSIGALIGAGCFVTMIVVGAVTLSATCTVQRYTFIRDVLFYFFGVSLVSVIVSRKGVRIWESLLLLLGYVTYVSISVVMGRYLRKRQRKTESLEEEPEEEDDFSAVSDLELEREAKQRKSYLTKAGLVSDSDALDTSAFPYDDIPEEIEVVHSVNAPLSDFAFDLSKGINLSVMRAYIVRATEWNEKDKMEKFLFVIFSPFSLMLSLTIPIPDDDNWNRWWAILCPVSIPLVVFLALGRYNLDVGPIPLIVLVEAVCVCLSVALYFTLSALHPPRFRMVFVVTSFVMSIIWIYMIAGELVSLLEALGEIMGIPSDILGLTVLAWGNSIGDFVSNVIVAKQGFPSMALAATYGGPFFNMYMGLGLSITVWTAMHYPHPYCVEFTPSVLLALVFLLTNLLLTLIVVGYNKFTIPRKFAFFLFGWYLTYNLLAIFNDVGLFTIKFT